MTTFYKKLTDELTKEAEKRGISDAHQVNTFVTKALHIKYGAHQQINISSVIADVFQQVNSGTRNLPDLPTSLASVDIDPFAYNVEVLQESNELLKRYKSKGIQPRMDEVFEDIKTRYGITTEDGFLLRQMTEEEKVKIARINTVTTHVLMGGNSPSNADSLEKLKLTAVVDSASKSLEKVPTPESLAAKADAALAAL